MLPCLVTAGEAEARPVALIPAADYAAWLARQPGALQAWLKGIVFEPKPGSAALLPGPDGAPAGALSILSGPVEPWDFAALRARLPAGDWRLEWQGSGAEVDQAALGWALASYRLVATASSPPSRSAWWSRATPRPGRPRRPPRRSTWRAI